MNRLVRSPRTFLWSVLSCGFVLLSGLTGPTFAQVPIEQVNIPSSPNPVGSGARALGMGGAFIAVADDATAASWNPGGLIQLERPEISGVGAYFHRTEDNTFGTSPEASGTQSVDLTRVNYLSASYPFKLWGCNMIVSGNYQSLYDFTREWKFSQAVSSALLSANQNLGHETEGSLSALGFAYAVQVTPKLSFGITLNFWEDSLYDNGWEEKRSQNGTGTLSGFPVNYAFSRFDKYSFSGFNVNLGALWNVTDKITLGAVFKTPFRADLRHELTSSSTVTFPTAPGSNTSSSVSFVSDEKLEMPMSYGIGIAYRFSDSFTASLDVYRTEWDDFELTDAAGNTISPITGLPTSVSDISPTHQVRLGAEYLFIQPKYVIPVRAGVFYDPAPASGSPDDFYGFTVGTGIGIGRFIFDIAYQYRFGKDVGKSTLPDLNFSQDVDEHTVYASIIIHF